MNILVVFTTHSSGSQEDYDKTWKCIKKNAFGYREKEIDGGTGATGKIYVFDGMGYYDQHNNRVRYDNIVGKIKLIFNDYKCAMFAVLFHATNEEKKILCEKIKSSGIKVTTENFLIKEYSAANCVIWDKYISRFCEDESIQDKFNSLWNHLWDDATLKKAQALRSEILSPLVALDLLNQAEENGSLEASPDINDLKRKIQGAIDSLEGPIEEFCKLKIECDEFEDQLHKLRKYGNHTGWEGYHKTLKFVAKKMEEQIATHEA